MNTVMEEKVSAYKLGVGRMNEALPGITEAYHAFTGECMKSGAIDEKQKQLIALGISLFANNEVCTLYHVNEALHKGATALEILETVGVAGALGGGYVMSQGVTRVQSALDSVQGGGQHG
ncbi:carboxymuconolactone decarboxylase family protein [Gorillibacterium sp. sgz5001074]|uniref:carboxymuconolactone decarboxylase family protein n=1 Tax=Gorillibacterium sp. sgz5001074 TaxID=3446695 RepID=UPI003F66385D